MARTAQVERKTWNKNMEKKPMDKENMDTIMWKNNIKYIKYCRKIFQVYNDW